MSNRKEDLAESLRQIDDAIEEIRDEIPEAANGHEYEDLIAIKTDLLRDRQAVVEQLEALGLEDPDL